MRSKDLGQQCEMLRKLVVRQGMVLEGTRVRHLFDALARATPCLVGDHLSKRAPRDKRVDRIALEGIRGPDESVEMGQAVALGPLQARDPWLRHAHPFRTDRFGALPARLRCCTEVQLLAWTDCRRPVDGDRPPGQSVGGQGVRKRTSRGASSEETCRAGRSASERGLSYAKEAGPEFFARHASMPDRRRAYCGVGSRLTERFPTRRDQRPDCVRAGRPRA